MIYDRELTPVQYPETGVKILHFYKKESAACFRMHWHDRLELIRAREGKLLLDCGDGVFSLSENQIALFPPRMPHKGTTLEFPVRYDVIMFDIRSFINETRLIKERFNAIYEGCAKFRTVIDHADVLTIFDRIIENGEAKGLDTIAMVYSLIDLLFSTALLEYNPKIQTDPFLKDVLEYIQANFSTDLSTETMSGYFGYTASHFCRKFKNATRLSPMKYLQIYRLEQASKMIKESKQTVAKIAVDCGFSDQNYFARCFKAHFGITPTQYR